MKYFLYFSVVKCPTLPESKHGSYNTTDHHYTTALNVQCDYGDHIENATDKRIFYVPDFRKVEYEDMPPPRVWSTNATLMCGENGDWITEEGDVVPEESLDKLCQRK